MDPVTLLSSYREIGINENHRFPWVAQSTERLNRACFPVVARKKSRRQTKLPAAGRCKPFYRFGREFALKAS